MGKGDGASTFGALLRRYRQEAGLSQEELAERAGMSSQAIGALERGDRKRPYPATVRRLADALGLASDEQAALIVAARPNIAAFPAAPTDTSPTQEGQAITTDPVADDLPPQLTSLLGREREESAVAHLLLQPNVRLLTLTGPGGVGKTRLAIQVAAGLRQRFADSVCFVDLAPLRTPDLVLPALAEALGLREVGGQPLAALLRGWLHARQVLLVLDNFEHLLPAAPEVAALLAACPRVQVLVTSRAALHIRGEHEFAVPPLELPNADDEEDDGYTPPSSRSGSSLVDMGHYGAIALFVQRAQALMPTFVLTSTNVATVVAICRRLDGLPLAIELTAAWSKLLPPTTLLARLSHRLNVLSDGPRDLPERQRTMRATIAWSEDLLASEERALFRRLSVFADGCGLEAVEAVCAAPAGAERLGMDTLEGLSHLVGQSLLQQREQHSDPRFSMLQVIREAALEQLDASGEAVLLRVSHAHYFLELAEKTARRIQCGEHQIGLLTRLESEHGNLRAALDWSLEGGAADMTVRLCAALGVFWVVRGHWSEGRLWVERAVAVSGAQPTHQYAELLRWAGRLASMQGDYATATTRYSESLALFRHMDDKIGSGLVIQGLAYCARDQGHIEQAERLFKESLALLQDADDKSEVLGVLRGLAELEYIRGDYPAAERILEQALALAQSLGNTHDIALCKARLGWYALLRGELTAAQALLHDALTVQQQLSDRHGSAISLGYLGMLALERGDAVEAHALFDQSLVLFEQLVRNPRIGSMLARLGQARFSAGDLRGAEEAYLASLRVERPFANQQRTAACFEGLAEVALARGQPERTAQLLGAAVQALGKLPPSPLPPRVAAQREHVALAARQALGEDAWAAAYAAWQPLALDEAIAKELGGAPASSPSREY
jgi:predicted ATPase/transcriptional regulator with XRE-family HTH domain